MKVIVFFSGGKDSQASLIWAVNKYGVNYCEAVFCDTGWEHPSTYKHIEKITDDLGVKLTIIKSEKYDGFVDMSINKRRFPSTTARFCTDELKSKPAIDYVLDQKEHLIIIEGIRADESFKRSLMKPQCTYFKHYFEPMPNGKTHNYRKKDVVAWCKEFNADKIRPIFDWTAQQTVDFIRKNGHDLNPLYHNGFKRVGCFPCIMARHWEVHQIIKQFPKYWDRLKQGEKTVGTTFFAPDFIPEWATHHKDKGRTICTAEDVENYILSKNSTPDIWEPEEGYSCMSFYGLCE